jgi:hypothetical protein
MNNYPYGLQVVYTALNQHPGGLLRPLNPLRVKARISSDLNTIENSFYTFSQGRFCQLSLRPLPVAPVSSQK